MILQPMETWMRQAVELAKLGRGRVEPNPMVGCVIVKAGRVIGQGYHQTFGEAHAEPRALAACTEPAAGAMAVVTLEPCCHLKKKTPPCVPALLAAGIREVVVGTMDPNPAVSGGGVAQLRAAGVRVTVGLLEAACRQVIAPWVALTQLHRPYVTLKWAQSADGLVAGSSGRPVRISNAVSTRFVHELRARCDGILVGINTVLTDDPLLTARDVPTTRVLTRIVLDRDLRLPVASRLAKSAGEAPVLAFCSEPVGQSERAQTLRCMGVIVKTSPLGADGQLDLASVLSQLGQRQMTHLLVESGPTLARAFVQSNMADRAWVFRCPLEIGQSDAPRAPEMPWPVTARRDLGGDMLSEHLNAASPVFFAPEPSADL